MDKNTVYLVGPERARTEARKELGEAAQQEKDGIVDQLTRINELAASYNYDPMRLVLGILRGTSQAYEAEGNAEVSEALTSLLRLFTELDVILEVHDSFQNIMGKGVQATSSDTLWAKVSAEILNRD